MQPIYKVHSFYIVAILLSIIIGLVSVEWSQIPGLVEYITFALTVSSLILAVLAIIYSIYSNASLSVSLSDISTAASDLGRASIEIRNSNMELREDFKKIPERFDSVDAHLVLTHNKLNQFSLIEKETYTSAHGKESRGTFELANNDVVLDFLKGSSIRGLEMILMVVLAKKSNTAFNIEEVSEHIGEEYTDNFQYLLAYMIASKALGLCTHEYDGRMRYIITNVHPIAMEKTLEIITKSCVEAAMELSAEFEKEDSEAIDKWLSTIVSIGGFFGYTIEFENNEPKII